MEQKNQSKKDITLLFLPKTNFILKVNLDVYKDIFNFWEKEKVYNKLLLKNKDGKRFIVHDGPIYANGDIHLGHALNHVLKDIVVRFCSINGFFSPFVMGWDTHGLPIEHNVLKGLKNSVNLTVSQIRDKCNKFALSYSQKQRQQLAQLGLFTDYSKFYLTLDNKYQAEQIRVFANLVKKGLVYQDVLPLPWSCSHQTVLAENEIEYFPKEGCFLYFKLLLKDFENSWLPKKSNLLVWTTQPWTITENYLAAVRSDSNYVLVKYLEEFLIFSESRLDFFSSLLEMELSPVLVFSGKDLLGLFYFSIYSNRDCKIVDGKDFVSINDGSGIVHLAPFFGLEDYNSTKKENIFLKDNPLDPDGKFNSNFSVAEWVGKKYIEVNFFVLEDLKNRNISIKLVKEIHSYPHDWRDKQPLVYRLTKQWFVKVSAVKDSILKNIRLVKWTPSFSSEKMKSIIESRNDWCISRQRSWGLFLPIIFNKKNKDPILNPEVIEYIADLVYKAGPEGWFMDSFVFEIEKKFPELGDIFLSKDTLDVWFDSGVSFWCSLKQKDDIFPADLYLEGCDQYRGWFNSSLINSVILTGQPPYKEVLVHGFVVDEKNKKMSKSIGNVTTPQSVIERFGPDVLRLWVAGSDFIKEVKISEQRLKTVHTDYQKIRNTFRYLLANLYSYDIENETKKGIYLSKLDNYVLSKLFNLLKETHQDYLDYKFSFVLRKVIFFCVNDLSSFYFSVVKEKLYSYFVEDSCRRQQIMKTFFLIIKSLLKVIAPILPFLAEEVYKELSSFIKISFTKELTIFLTDFSSLVDNHFEQFSLIEKQEQDSFNNLLEFTFFPFKEKIFLAIEEAIRQNPGKKHSQASVFVFFFNCFNNKEKIISLDTKCLLQVREVLFFFNKYQKDNNAYYKSFSNFEVLIKWI